MAKKNQETEKELTGAETKAAQSAGAKGSAPPSPPAQAVAADEGKPKKKRPGHAPRLGKKARNQLKNVINRIRKEGVTPLEKAIGLLKQVRKNKFDETVEVHMSLGVDVTQSDQIVRGAVSLPHGIGKSVRVVVFCQGENVAKAEEAGADFAGGDELIKKIQQDGWLDFDVALATQDMMGKVSRLGKVLGPRGLMPSPKAGTIVQDVAAGVQEFKAGKVEYRTDKTGNVHAGVGKLSFDDSKLVENIKTFVDQVRAVKPSGVKGNYVRSISICSTMSPGIPVSM
jgi:large subunit ribosomal protein L1